MPDPSSILQKLASVKLWRMILMVALPLSILAQLVVAKKPHFAFETWPAFIGAFSFAASVALALIARYILRPLTQRREDYYD